MNDWLSPGPQPVPLLVQGVYRRFHWLMEMARYLTVAESAAPIQFRRLEPAGPFPDPETIPSRSVLLIEWPAPESGISAAAMDLIQVTAKLAIRRVRVMAAFGRPDRELAGATLLAGGECIVNGPDDCRRGAEFIRRVAAAQPLHRRSLDEEIQARIAQAFPDPMEVTPHSGSSPDFNFPLC